ncbi:transposase [Pseudomonas sp. BIGb0450]|nr:transposase [Pseudomonas sp. BIGb0558]MCS3436944.1 transposase [Pseudomonas sp. BIGb0450]
MKRFIQSEHRGQGTLLPESLDDYVSDTNPVRVVDVFVDELDLVSLGFEGAIPADTGRPAYHPAILLKIYIYGYLNRIQSSRRLEREAQRNIELMWLTARLMPDFKTIANFRKDNSRPSEASVASSWCSASSWDYSENIWLPSTAANSRPSTTATAISPAPSCNGEWKKLNRVSTVT